MRLRTMDTCELAAGAFGHFCDKRGHGSYIKWVPKPTGWAVEPVRVSDEIVLPTPVVIMVHGLDPADVERGQGGVPKRLRCRVKLKRQFQTLNLSKFN